MSPHSESETPAAPMADDTTPSPRGLTGYSLLVDVNNPAENAISQMAPPVNAGSGQEAAGVAVGTKKKKKKSKGKSKNKAVSLTHLNSVTVSLIVTNVRLSRLGLKVR